MLLTITSATWYMAGISVAVVFAILVVLVLVLNLFSIIAKYSEEHVHYHHEDAPVLAPGEHHDAAVDDDAVVVATAVYLYLNSAQDEESGVITIDNTQPSAWHAVLNPRF